MSGHNIASRSSEKLLFFGFLVLVRSVLCHGFAEEFTSGSHDFGSVILEPLDGLRKYVESIVGTHVVEICVQVTFLLFMKLSNDAFFNSHRKIQLIFVHKGCSSIVEATYLTEVLITFL